MTTEPPAPPGSRLRRRVVAGAAIGILALGIWLGNMFKGLGPGGGTEGGAERSSASGENGAAEDGQLSVTLGTPQASGAASPSNAANSSRPSPEGAPAEILGVLLYEDGYRLPRDTTLDVTTLSNPVSPQFAPATLEEVVSRARLATGSPSGIRVLIFRHLSSTIGAKQKLLQALHEAGVRDGEIHQRTDYYD